MKKKPEVLTKRHAHWKYWFGLFLVLLGTLIWWLNQDNLFVYKISISSKNPADTSPVESYLSTYLDERIIIGILPRRHEWLLRPKKITEDLVRLFPVFKNVRVEVFSGEMIVELENREPHSLWCVHLDTDQERCWFVDEQKIMFKTAPRFSEGVYLKYADGKGGAPAMGFPAMSYEQILQSNAYLRVLESQRLIATRLIFVSDTIWHIHIRSLFQQNLPVSAHLIINPEQSPEEIDTKLSLLLATTEFETEVSTRPSDFAYADLRFPSRLVYKMNND